MRAAAAAERFSVAIMQSDTPGPGVSAPARSVLRPLTSLISRKFDIPIFGYLLLAAAVVVLWGLPFLPAMDAQVRADSLGQLLGEGRLTETRYSLYGPLVSSPLWFIGRWVGDTSGCLFLFNRVVFIGSLFVLGWLLRGAVGERERVRFLVALALGSMFPHNLMNYMGEVFTAAAVGVGLAAVAVRRAWWGWPVMLLGVASTPATIPAFGCAVLVLCVDRRRFRYLLAVGVAAGLMFAENYLRRGDPLNAGYERDRNLFPNALPYSGQEGFCYPIVFGVLSVLFSFGKGLVFYAPGLFLPYPAGPHGPAADARARLLYRVWLAFLVGLVLVYGRWWCWSGSWCWGPRFFLFAGFPAALILARWVSVPRAGLAMNVLLLVVIGLACWVGGSGMVFHDYGIQPFMENSGVLDFVVFYVPECSALWWPYTYHSRIGPLSTADWWRLGVCGAAAVYLAAPIVPTTVLQVRAAVAGVWGVYRSGPRFRF
ncbi:MAG: hypothetical protein JWO38_2595 [Gemmataceae bacterium]|nr:hypothetical protein [Gemmataceae bacterium]